jgi:hypothetical protein
MTKLFGPLIVALMLAPMQTWAACAWVLWGEHIPEPTMNDPSPKTVWTVHTAYSKEDACKLEQDRWQDRDERRRQDWLKGGAKGSITLRVYHCLPDTIDPRGPKGDHQ